MLIIALLTKNTSLTKTSYSIILIAGVAALPVFFTGEGAEEAVENVPGVSEAIMERHEEVAKLAIFSIVAAGVAALTALFSSRWLQFARMLKFIVLLLALTSGGLMAQTAHLGGQIRHSEIRNGAVAENGIEAGGENETGEGNNREKEQDD